MLSSFLLIGQSNMSGRGILNADNRIFDARILRLVNGRWQTMWEPLSADRVFAGASLAPAFALEFVKRTGEQVGLIPASDGGSSIDEWQPGEALYDHAVSEARLAMRISDIKAVLWHQGEADCNPARAAVYAPKFLHMFRTLKKDLQLPDIRIAFISVQLNNIQTCPNVSSIQTLHITTASTRFFARLPPKTTISAM